MNKYTLTREHEARIPEWNAETLQQILSLEPVDFPKVVEVIRRCAALAKLPRPEVLLGPSPLALWAWGGRWPNVGGAATGEATWAATVAATRAATRAATGEATWEATWEATGTATREATGTATREATEAATWEATWEATANSWPNYDAWNGGREWLSWIRFLLFFRDVCGVQHDHWAEGQAYYDLQRYSGSCTIHYENVVLVSQPPIRRSLIQLSDGQYQLHQDGQAAVEYADGFRYYRLHGVAMPRWVVETPADLLDVAKGLALTNAEQRREFVRKVGVERVYQACGGQVLDTQGDYALITLSFGDKRHRPYLKMRNPSLGVWHVEGVPPTITTVQQAINWRAGDERTNWQPEVLT